MAVNISASHANTWLNTIRGGAAGTTYTAPAAVYVQLHTSTGAGTVGTSNVSSVTTRPAATFGAASAGAISLTNTPSWASWAGTNNEVVTGISVWDASSAGNFLWSANFASSVTMPTGATLNLTGASLTITTAS
jgi:hypothetical protein